MPKLPADPNQRRTVLIIAPDFTPSSYPPALRARFFAQHLREFGWDPIVLTTRPENYEWNVDPENEKLLDASVEVIRTGAWSIKWTRKAGFRRPEPKDVLAALACPQPYLPSAARGFDSDLGSSKLAGCPGPFGAHALWHPLHS